MSRRHSRCCCNCCDNSCCNNCCRNYPYYNCGFNNCGCGNDYYGYGCGFNNSPLFWLLLLNNNCRY